MITCQINISIIMIVEFQVKYNTHNSEGDPPNREVFVAMETGIWGTELNSDHPLP